jgi:hypothetical protein
LTLGGLPPGKGLCDPVYAHYLRVMPSNKGPQCAGQRQLRPLRQVCDELAALACAFGWVLAITRMAKLISGSAATRPCVESSRI